MVATRRHAAFVFSFVLAVFLIPTLASAATLDYRIFFDVDNNTATGCTVGGMQGVDQVLVTRVETTATDAHVTRTHRQVCSGGVFGASVDVNTTGWNTDFHPPSGALWFETRVSYDAFGSGPLPNGMRIGFDGTNGASVHSALNKPNGDPIIYPTARTSGGRQRSVFPGEPRTITMDASDDDWGLIVPAVQGIAGGGSQSLRMVKILIFGNPIDRFLYFGFNSFVSSNAPFATDDQYDREQGNNLTVPAPGVLANDADPNGQPLTALPVSPAANGDVTLNPDGSFTYTPDDPSSLTSDSFEYKANNGDLDSNVARVTIDVVVGPPIPNTPPIITSSNTATVPEGTTAIMTVTAADADADPIAFSITGGADQGRFTINAASGDLAFNFIPDFELPNDADANNQYVVQVTASDGTDPVNQTITVTVTNINEPPAFTSANTASVPENTTAIMTVTGSDPDGNPLTFSISGGPDQALFSINGATGALSFTAPRNFEAPADSDANNQYVVQVTMTDGSNPVPQIITVTVTNVNEAPTITSGSTPSVPENTTAVTTVTTTDPDGNTISYSISGGADAALFSINSSTGVLTFNAAPNFEAPADAGANNVYNVDVTATDGANPVSQSLTVTVTNVNEAPAITSGASPSIPENTTAVTTVTATDPEGAAITFSISGGADQAFFTINSTTGALAFLAPRNFEAPADADANNTYLVQVTATDGANPVAQSITVTITNVNEAPAFTSGNAFSVPENTTAITTVTTSDPEGAAMSYSLSGGADQSFFSINATTGVLSFTTARDFEAPADADTNNTYIVQVTATDGANPINQTITVTVTNVNDPPVITSSNAVSVNENTVAVLTVTTADPESDTVTYSLTGGADQAAFSIDTNTGVLTFNAPPDFDIPGDADSNNQYIVQVTANDGTTPVNQTITVTVLDVNEAPSFTSSATPSVPENTTAVITVTTTDPEGNGITFSISGGADQALFSINSSSGALTFNSAPNFELPGDAGANNVYNVDVTATDGTNPVVQNIAVTVTNVNEAPTFNGGFNTPSVPENTTTVTTVTTTDPEGNTVTYSISGGADAAFFAIDSNTGAVTFIAPPNFEAPADAGANNVYEVEVQATDGTTPVTDTIVVTVTDVNEAPAFTSSATPSMAENDTVVIDVVAVDPEGTAVTYSISGGADSALFTIDTNTGKLAFLSAPNFEAPGDAGANNVYDVQVTATDGTNPVAQNIAVTVTDVNEAPSITSGNAFSIPENTTTVTTVTTTDPESNTVTYSISGGADGALFSIDTNTGALAFLAPPNFEAPADADTNNTYIVQVTATDGTNPVNQTITVTVTDANEAPVFTSTATPSVPENTTAVVDVDATDPEGAGVSYSITGGADSALFTIVGGTGVLSFLSAPDFENPTDADTNNVYLVEVTATDGSNPAVQSLSVTVTDANDPPFFTSSATPSVAENTAVAVDVNATDPEAQTLTFSISGGDDAADFSIDPGTGVLSFGTLPNFEAPHDADTNNIYLVQVTVTDGVNPVVQNITVTVTDVNEPPTIITGNAFSVPENTTLVVDVNTTDPEGNTVTYSISGGADAGDFSIDTNTGVLSFNPAPDFENPTDADTNNIYIVQITATDGTNPVNQTITVTVTDANDPPVFTSTATPSVPENTVLAVDVDATDPEAVAVTYSITGGDDAADFDIDTNTGALTFDVAPNFEAPHDADVNNIYLVQVTATDGTNPVVQNISVTVTDVNEAPAFTSANSASVPENTTAVIDVDAVDPDGTSPTYSITGGADAGDFSIVPATGVLTFAVAPNFEAPADADANNIYLVEVTATDGTNPVVQSITVTVTDVNEAPFFTSANSASVAENQTSAIDVDATDPEGLAVTYSITGGADSGDFTIVPGTGVLTFAATPNFEAPADADTNNIYLVEVTATDGTNPQVQSITITVTNVNEAPANTLQDNTVSTNEDVNLAFTGGNANQITISDPDGDVNVHVTLTATNGTLSTNGVTGLTFVPPGAGNDGIDDTTLTFTGTISTINARLNGLTYKPNANYYGSATVTILTNDQGNTGSGGALQSNGGVPDSITVTIAPVNDKPVAASYLHANGNAHITHSGIGLSINVAHNNDLKEDATDVDDHDPLSELTVQLVGGTVSPANATVTLTHVDQATMGAFYFEPPGGLSGNAAASFQYQVCDNGDVGLGLAAQCSDPATVQFNITGSDTWFVDNATTCGATCNGSRTKPLLGLNNAALAGRGTGDKIFAFAGNYNHGFTFNANELLVGEGSSGAFDTLFAVSVPANGILDTRPTLTNNQAQYPDLAGTVTGASGITMRGIDIAATGATGFTSTGANGMTILESEVSSNQIAVSITNAITVASSVTFNSTDSTGGTHGINLSGVLGTYAFGTGSLSGNTTASFRLTDANSSTITYSGSLSPGGTGRAVSIGTADGLPGTNASNGLEASSSVTLSGAINGGGVAVYESSGGSLTLSNGTQTWNTGTTRGVDLIDNNSTTINFSGGNLAITTSSGIGFHASQGGTVNVTGTNNTISTTAGNAFEAIGTAGEHMGGGYAFRSISSTNGTKGISVQYHDGAFSVSGDGNDANTLPDNATAGGTITGSDQRGAEFIDVDGPISLGGMTFTNPADTAGPDASVAAGTCGNIPSGGSNTGCFAGIHIDTAANVTLHTVNVTGSGQIGINGNAISNLIIDTVNVSNSGNTSGEDGMRLYNLSGTGGSVNALAVTNSFGKGLLIENTNVVLATAVSPYTITNSSFQNSSNAQGANLNTATTGTMHVKFLNGTISGNFSNGIQTAGLGSGTLGIYIDNTNFSNNTSAVVVQSSGGTTSFDIRNIDHIGRTTNASCGVCLKTDGSGTATGSVINNLIGNGTLGSGASCGGGCNGLNIDARNTSSMTVDVRGNTIRNVDQNGIGIRGGEGSSSLEVTLTGNLIKDPDGGVTLAAIFADSGVLSSDTNCVTVLIGGTTAWPGAPTSTVGEIQNRIEGAWATSGVRVRKLFGGGAPPEPVFNLPNYDGSGVVNWIQTRNSFSGVATPVTQNTGTGGAFTGATSCP